MKTTLISAIGRGRKDADGTTYSKIAYTVNGTPQPPTPFFVQAWLLSPQGADVDRVELLGTATSSWSALAEEFGETDLFCQLEELCGQQDSCGVNNQHLTTLSEALSQRWKRQVRCHVLCHREVDDSEAPQILEQLLNLFPLEEPEREILIDTTHALRTLPLLALSAVQIADALAPGVALRTRLLYGEFLGKDRGRAVVFNSVLENLRMSRALSRFLDGFDASQLATILEINYPKLSKALLALDACLAANTLNRLDERLSQLRNSLPKDASGLHDRIFSMLHIVLRRLDRPTLSQRLLALAEIRAERGQFAFAILALAEAVQVLAIEKSHDRNLESYELRKQVFHDFMDSLPKDQKIALNNLLIPLRNHVAHGATFEPVNRQASITEQSQRRQWEQAHQWVKKILLEQQ